MNASSLVGNEGELARAAGAWIEAEPGRASERKVGGWRLLGKIARSQAHLLLEGGSTRAQSALARTMHHMSGGSDGTFRSIESERSLDRAGTGSMGLVPPAGMSNDFERPRATFFFHRVDTYTRWGQRRLLDALESGGGSSVERKGLTGNRGFSWRMIFGSEEPLEEGVRQGTFHPALYFRLAVLRMELPGGWEPKERLVAPAELWSLLGADAASPLRLRG